MRVFEENFEFSLREILTGARGGDLLFDGIRGCAAQMACFISLSSVTMGAF